MECKKIIILTDSDVLHSWCAEELHGISDVTVVSFRNLTVSIKSLFDAFDAVVVDYSLENFKRIFGKERDVIALVICMSFFANQRYSIRKSLSFCMILILIFFQI